MATNQQNELHITQKISYFPRIPPDVTTLPTYINIQEEDDDEENHIYDRPITRSLEPQPPLPDKNHHRER